MGEAVRFLVRFSRTCASIAFAAPAYGLLAVALRVAPTQPGVEHVVLVHLPRDVARVTCSMCREVYLPPRVAGGYFHVCPGRIIR